MPSAVEENAGFATANNVGIDASRGRLIVLVNSDAFPDPGSIDRLIAALDELPAAGIVGGRLRYPTGEQQTLLSVPHYDFSWQLAYFPVADIVMPKGSKIECTAHFDNSSANPNNPNPGAFVIWGDQTWYEMMLGYFDYYHADG